MLSGLVRSANVMFAVSKTHVEQRFRFGEQQTEFRLGILSAEVRLPEVVDDHSLSQSRFGRLLWHRPYKVPETGVSRVDVRGSAPDDTVGGLAFFVDVADHGGQLETVPMVPLLFFYQR